MTVSFWLCIAFSIGFTIESIFGFGGGIVAYSILGFLFDIKQIVIVGLYVGTLSAFVIVATSLRHIKLNIIKKFFIYIIIGVIVGVLSFKYLNSKKLILIYSISLMIISVRALFFKDFAIKENIAKYIFFAGGFIQGVLGLGGPFLAFALKSQNIDKSVFRASLSLIFVLVNIYRYLQLCVTEVIEWNFFTKFWFVPIPVMVSLWIGYLIHKKIPQQKFDKYIYVGILVSSIAFLFLLY